MFLKVSTEPNKAVEPTPSSVRSAPASGRGSPLAFGARGAEEKPKASAPGSSIPEGCDRAIPNPNQSIESFDFKIKRLLHKLYNTGCNANSLDEGPLVERLLKAFIATII